MMAFRQPLAKGHHGQSDLSWTPPTVCTIKDHDGWEVAHGCPPPGAGLSSDDALAGFIGAMMASCQPPLDTGESLCARPDGAKRQGDPSLTPPTDRPMHGGVEQTPARQHSAGRPSTSVGLVGRTTDRPSSPSPLSDDPPGLLEATQR